METRTRPPRRYTDRGEMVNAYSNLCNTHARQAAQSASHYSVRWDDEHPYTPLSAEQRLGLIAEAIREVVADCVELCGRHEVRP